MFTVDFKNFKDLFNTASSWCGDNLSDKDELLIRVYDEDYGIKGQLDQILSIEGIIRPIDLKNILKFKK